MAHAVAFTRQTLAQSVIGPHDLLRSMIVCGCALAVILAS